MGIFGSIRNAIFGQAREAQTTATGSSTIPPVSGQAQPAATQQPVDVEIARSIGRGQGALLPVARILVKWSPAGREV